MTSKIRSLLSRLAAPSLKHTLAMLVACVVGGMVGSARANYTWNGGVSAYWGSGWTGDSGAYVINTDSPNVKILFNSTPDETNANYFYIENGGAVTFEGEEASSGLGLTINGELVVGTHMGSAEIALSNVVIRTTKATDGDWGGDIIIGNYYDTTVGNGVVTIGRDAELSCGYNAVKWLILGNGNADGSGKGNGTLYIDEGGVLGIHHIESRAGDGILNFRGGTLRALSDNAVLIGNTENWSGSTAPTVNINAKGAIIDTQSYTSTISTPILGTGPITKKGTGMLTFTGSMAGYKGAIIVDENGGSVVLPEGTDMTYILPGKHTVVNGTTFTYDANWNYDDVWYGAESSGNWSDAARWSRSLQGGQNVLFDWYSDQPSPLTINFTGAETCDRTMYIRYGNYHVVFNGTTAENGLTVTGANGVNIGGVQNAYLDITAGTYSFKKLNMCFDKGWWNKPEDYGAVIGSLAISSSSVEVDESIVFKNYESEYPSTGIITLNSGGKLIAKTIEVGHSVDGDTATLAFNGGTLKASDTASGTVVGSGITVTVDATNGGTIDTNGKDITIASAVTGTGKLTLTGGGIVRFSDSYACSIVLEGTTTAYDSSNNEIKTAFTWKGSTGANWSDGSNWWGGSAPGASDKAVFEGNASVTINANATVGGIVINNNAEVTLAKIGTSILYVRGNIEDSTATKNSGKLILSGVTIAAQAATLINAKLSFAENTTSTIQTDGDYGGFNVEIYGDVDGAGTVNWFTGGNYNNSRREHGILFYCSFAEFRGESYVQINDYLHYLKMVSDSCLNCRRSKWHFYEEGAKPRYDTNCRGGYQFYSGVSNGSALKFGKLCGSIFGRYNNSNYHDPLNVVFEVGYLPGEDSDISGEINGDGLNQTLDWVSESATLKYSISNFQRLVVSGGGNAEFRDASKLPVAICFTNNAGFVRFADGVTGSDILAKFKSSTAAIGFDDMNVSYNWNGEIDNSNSGGFTKKGGGTLTLSTAPKYTGTTTVLAGTLAITESKTFADPVVVSGGTFTPAAGSVFNGAVTVSSGTFDASAGATFGGDVEMTGGAIKIARGASIPSLALTEAGALNVDLASATLADGTALFTVASVADGATVNYLNQPEGFDALKIQVVEQGGNTVYVYGVRTLIWNGASTTDVTSWSDSANWGDAGVPSAVDNISLPANPGFVLTEAVAVNDLTAASGLTLNLAYDLTVNGDLNVTGALVKNGPGKLIVKGTIANTLTAVTINGGTIEGSLPSSVALTLDSAALSSDTYTSTFGATVVLGSAGTITDLSGDGTIVADATQTYSSSLDKTFVGTIGGTGGFTKAGSGTLTLVGSNSYEGDFTISSGTLKLGSITDISDVRYNMDASAPNAFSTDAEGKITAWNSTVGTINFGYNYGSYIITNVTTLINERRAAYFCPDYVDNKSASYKLSENNASRRTDTIFFVYNLDSDSADWGKLWGEAAHGTHKYSIEHRSPNGHNYWFYNNDKITEGFYYNGVYKKEVNGAYQKNVTQVLVSAKTSTVRSGSTSIYEEIASSGDLEDGKSGIKGLVGQVTAFTRVLSCEERMAAEAYLMDRWGVGSAGYHVIPESAGVSIANAATLDLNGLSQKVASLTAASGSTLKMTSDATLTVSGAASVDGMTLKLTDTPSSGETYVLLTAASITGDVMPDVTGNWAVQVVDNGNNTKSLVLSDTVNITNLAHEHATATVTAGGEPVTVDAGVAAVPVGSDVVITWTAEAGYQITDGGTQNIDNIREAVAATAPTVSALPAVTVAGVTATYGADFATADVTVSLTGDDVNGKEYKLTVGGETKTATAEKGKVTFTGVATGHSTAYDSFEYSLSSDAVTVSDGSGSKTIADEAAWFQSNSTKTEGGAWENALSWSEGKATVGDGNQFEPTVASDASVVDVSLQVCFGDANDDAIELADAKAAVKIATVEVNDVDTLVFQALNDGEFVTLTGITPVATKTYTVALHLDYAARKYTVKIGDTMMQYNDSELLAMPDTATAMSAVAFAGQGTLTSLVGETSEGYVAMDAAGNRYVSLDVAMTAGKANPTTKLPLTVLHDGTLNNETYTKSSQVLPTGVNNVTINAADQTAANAAAAKMEIALTSDQVTQGLKKDYYKAVATKNGDTTYTLSIELDETEVAPTVAADEDDSAMKVTTSSVSLNVTNTKAGLYYGIAAGNTPEDVAVGTMTKCDTDGDDLNLTADMPESGVKYYKVIVDDKGN